MKGFIKECVDKAMIYGDSLSLSREIQAKYETRPVKKDVFVCIQDLEIDIIDVLPKCIFSSGKTSRLLFMNRTSELNQYDIANQTSLKPLYLGTQVPLGKSALLDSCFDEISGKLYTLNDKWVVESWQIGQSSQISGGRIRLFTENVETMKIINYSYKRRFRYSLP